MPRALLFGIKHYVFSSASLPSSFMFCIGLYKGEHGKIFLSETTRAKAMIFGV